MNKIIKVEGMVCEGCENRIKNVLSTLENVENVKADYKTGTVEIISTEEISEEIIKEKIEDLGFEIVEE